MAIKWTKHNRLGKEPRIIGISEQHPDKIFYKDADGNVTSKKGFVRVEAKQIVRAEDTRAMNTEALQQYTAYQRSRLAEITSELEAPTQREIDPSYRHYQQRS
jgi:hypothetical protein